ncbi:maspardin-like isoform X2 [Artemia franciscana]|uniref:maspardin-like isoform X2 n=1 Tax=Artemia franciscana TaxID=6661 RepID=UPI0032DA8248
MIHLRCSYQIVWSIFDSGPRTCRCPLVCLPSVSGTADVFFFQVLALSAKGLRVITVSYPVYWNHDEWCEGFLKLINFLRLEKVHLFGASLGGFLAQKFAEYSFRLRVVASMIFCNSFTDTSIFRFSDVASILWVIPSVILKKMILQNFMRQKMDPAICRAVDFMVTKLESLCQSELASRLTLNSISNKIDTTKVSYQGIPITIIDVFDLSALSNRVKDALYKAYPLAKLAHMKSGGNFPYLSHPEDVNLFIEVHLRKFSGTPESPFLN